MIRKRTLILLNFVFIGFSSQASIKSNNETRRINREEWAGTCNTGMVCTSISNCHTNFTGTIFPCGVENRGTLFVCCPESDTSTKKTTTSITNNKITITPPKTTPTNSPKKMTNQKENKWASIPKSLQAKTKLLPKVCGFPQTILDKIINGNDTQLGEYPWMVLLGYESNGETYYYCGGTLINDRYVLTAAHCSSSNSLQPTFARLGEWDISREKDCVEIANVTDCADPVEDVKIEQFIVHERFADPDLPSYQNDIALIRLAKKVTFTEFISPICLEPTNYQNFSANYVISGWGTSEAGFSSNTPILQHAFIPLYHFGECNSIAPSENRPLSTSQFCAGGDSQNSCNGDSGGPLVYMSPKNRLFHLKGIISLATSSDCGASGNPNIYTEVVSYIDWILEKMKE